MTPQKIPISSSLEPMNVLSYVKKGGEDFADMIKDLEMDRLSWISRVGPKCNHMYPYKREAEGY